AQSPKALGDEHTVNGALKIGENISDLGGLSIALKAYERSLAGEESPVIDGYTGIQRVFLSYAQVWQLAIRDAEAILLLTVDPHSSNEYRANQRARNVDASYEDFGVTEGDELYLAREKRVCIWCSRTSRERTSQPSRSFVAPPMRLSSPPCDAPPRAARPV